MLSSFINRRKVKKISLFDAALRRTPSATALDVQSDQESSRPKQWSSQSKSFVPAVATLRSSVLHRLSSPKVHLDFIPSGSNDWLSQEILASLDEDGHLPIQSVPQSSASSAYEDVVVIGPTVVSFFRSFTGPRLSPSLQSFPRSRTLAQPYLRYRSTMALPQQSQDTMYVPFASRRTSVNLFQFSHHHSRLLPHLCHGNLHRRQLKYQIIHQRSRYSTLLPPVTLV